jgi:signal transduction histidine kinase
MDWQIVTGAPRAVVTVRDHGPGVAGEAVDSLFLPFHRGANGRSESPNGTGLGLTITRRIFEVHGGTATAANAAGGGLIVTLELPTRPADHSEVSRAWHDVHDESGRHVIYGMDPFPAKHDAN